MSTAVGCGEISALQIHAVSRAHNDSNSRHPYTYIHMYSCVHTCTHVYMYVYIHLFIYRSSYIAICIHEDVCECTTTSACEEHVVSDLPGGFSRDLLGPRGTSFAVCPYTAASKHV